MPVKIKSTGGGSVTMAAASTASDFTLTLPAVTGTVLQSGTTITAAQGGTGLTSPGASGNVLTSDGTNWTSAAPTSTGVNVQTFTSSGTWTKPSLAAGSRVLIQAWGGGGGGGRGTGYGGGGGGGGYNERWVTLSAMGATETITIGAGGAARTTDGDGNNGGNTTVGSLITAYGGGGGSGYGGSGGGQLSAGENGSTGGLKPGKPWFYLGQDSNSGYTMYVGAGGSIYSAIYGVTAGYGTDAFHHGAGGGANNGTYNGGSSVWGGGGGAGRNTGAAGTSSFGGNGGGVGLAGTQPGGGGGGVTGANSGAGGAGQVIITVFPA